LKRRGGVVTYSDPYGPSIRIEDEILFASDMADTLPAVDCAVIITDHSDFDYEAIVRNAPMVVDTRNSLRGINSEKIIRL
jgi:UDP-N-acetyl-D-glucosamine dehydrogenase